MTRSFFLVRAAVLGAVASLATSAAAQTGVIRPNVTVVPSPARVTPQRPGQLTVVRLGCMLGKDPSVSNSDDRDFVCRGRVRNSGSTQVRFARFKINVISASGRVIDSDGAPLDVQTLGPGAESAFELIFYLLPEQAVRASYFFTEGQGEEPIRTVSGRAK